MYSLEEAVDEQNDLQDMVEGRVELLDAVEGPVVLGAGEESVAAERHQKADQVGDDPVEDEANHYNYYFLMISDYEELILHHRSY